MNLLTGVLSPHKPTPKTQWLRTNLHVHEANVHKVINIYLEWTITFNNSGGGVQRLDKLNPFTVDTCRLSSPST